MDLFPIGARKFAHRRLLELCGSNQAAQKFVEIYGLRYSAFHGRSGEEEHAVQPASAVELRGQFQALLDKHCDVPTWVSQEEAEALITGVYNQELFQRMCLRIATDKEESLAGGYQIDPALGEFAVFQALYERGFQPRDLKRSFCFLTTQWGAHMRDCIRFQHTLPVSFELLQVSQCDILLKSARDPELLEIKAVAAFLRESVQGKEVRFGLGGVFALQKSLMNQGLSRACGSFLSLPTSENGLGFLESVLEYVYGQDSLQHVLKTKTGKLPLTVSRLFQALCEPEQQQQGYSLERIRAAQPASPPFDPCDVLLSAESWEAWRGLQPLECDSRQVRLAKLFLLCCGERFESEERRRDLRKMCQGLQCADLLQPEQAEALETFLEQFSTPLDYEYQRPLLESVLGRLAQSQAQAYFYSNASSLEQPRETVALMAQNLQGGASELLPTAAAQVPLGAFLHLLCLQRAPENMERLFVAMRPFFGAIRFLESMPAPCKPPEEQKHEPEATQAPQSVAEANRSAPVSPSVTSQREENSYLRQELQSAQKSLKLQQEQNAELCEEVERLQQSYGRLKEQTRLGGQPELSSLFGSLDAVQKQLRDAQKDLKRVQNEKEALLKKTQETEEKLRKTEEEKASLELDSKELFSLKPQLAQANKERDALTVVKAKLIGEIKTLKALGAQASQPPASGTPQIFQPSQAPGTQPQASQVPTQTQTQKQKTENSQKTETSMKTENPPVSGAVEALQADIKRLKVAYNAVVDELEAYDAKYDAAEQKAAAQAQRAERLGKELDEAYDELDAQDAEILKLRKTVEKLQEVQETQESLKVQDEQRAHTSQEKTEQSDTALEYKAQLYDREAEAFLRRFLEDNASVCNPSKEAAQQPADERLRLLASFLKQQRFVPLSNPGIVFEDPELQRAVLIHAANNYAQYRRTVQVPRETLQFLVDSGTSVDAEGRLFRLLAEGDDE